MSNHITTKVCKDCGKDKSIDLFHREGRSPDGRRSNCKECRSAYQRVLYVEKRPEILEAKAKEHRENIESHREYQRKYHALNSDKKNASGKAWRASNEDYVLAYNRSYYEQNKEEMAEKQREWVRNNRHAVSALNHKRRALKRNAYVDAGISVVSLREIHGDYCVYCRSLMDFDSFGIWHPLKATVEHVIPLSRGGLHSFDNTCLACSRCNSRKRDKLVSEWKTIEPTGKN